MEAQSAAPAVPGGLSPVPGDAPVRLESVRHGLARPAVRQGIGIVGGIPAAAAIVELIGIEVPDLTPTRLGLIVAIFVAAAVFKAVRSFEPYNDRMAGALPAPAGVEIQREDERAGVLRHVQGALGEVLLVTVILVVAQILFALLDEPGAAQIMVAGIVGRSVGEGSMRFLVGREETERGVVFLWEFEDEDDEADQNGPEHEDDDEHDPGPLFYVERQGPVG